MKKKLKLVCGNWNKEWKNTHDQWHCKVYQILYHTLTDDFLVF